LAPRFKYSDGLRTPDALALPVIQQVLGVAEVLRVGRQAMLLRQLK
jgi:hypothetical protein